MNNETTKHHGQLWLLASEGEAGRDLMAEVAVRVRTFRLYHYAIPDTLRDLIRPGVMVRVPYGRSGTQREGWCVRISRREHDHTLKPIDAVLPGDSLLSPALIELGLWVGAYYACPPAQTLDALVPAVLRKQRPRRVQYVRATGASSEERLSPNQRALLRVVGTHELRRDQALQKAGVSASSLQTLCKRGLLEKLIREELPPTPTPTDPIADSPTCPEDALVLSGGQQAALDAIGAAAEAAEPFKVFLLFGVPGSGKTEVYVRAIRRVIAAGRQAIVLVPEIALATQVVERLARRFARVAVLHSRLKASTRVRNLREIAAGNVDVVIGTRTAVFAPCPRLGLIVVDEEQESSFKNLKSPFFHARDVAIKRGQIERVPVVLGSATPALETWYNARTQPHFTLLRLPERVGGAELPTVRVVRPQEHPSGFGSAALSPELASRLRETIAGGRQAILLHNRRGYASNLRCEHCGLVVSCLRCGAHMVYHQADNCIKCHRCGARRAAPANCPDNSCNGRLLRGGTGIQRLEQELTRLLPQARLLRLDTDTMRRREDYAEALRRFADREADILLGTQMVAKGLDFPQVQLVGVLDADSAMRLPDFRAAEFTFQLLVQVVGRAGRKDGASLALIQANEASHPVILAAQTMDYEAFAETELALRRELFDPPFSRLVRLVCSDVIASRARAAAGTLGRRLRSFAERTNAGIRVDEAEDCVIARMRDLHRCHVMVRLPRSADVCKLIAAADAEKVFSVSVRRLTIDVDPRDML